MTGNPVWVYVDVVCDLFHPGHIEFFRKARSLGDGLIVGLVGDAEVATYKPPPIMSFAERRLVVEACRDVDRVLEAPAPLHCTPDFLDAIGAAFCVHGDDMDQPELDFWYRALLPSGRLRTVSYSAGISTRQIVARTLDRYAAGTLRLQPKQG